MCCKTPKQKTLSETARSERQLVDARLEELKSLAVPAVVAEIGFHGVRVVDTVEASLRVVEHNFGKAAGTRANF